jgi:hypothetical protein
MNMSLFCLVAGEEVDSAETILSFNPYYFEPAKSGSGQV